VRQTPSQRNQNQQKEDDLRYDVRPTVPGGYEDLGGQTEYSADLKTPSNITTEAIYDPETGCYVIHTKLGDRDIVTPFYLSPSEYNDLVMRESMMAYYREKNAESAEEQAKNPFNFLDMQFGLGPLEKVFGPGGVQLKTTGSVTINMGIKSNKTDNPALSVESRRKTYFDFDNKIQATVAASVGDKMKFNMTYNTDATFEFDNKNLKLAYEGKEDEIIKNIEAGNVSMTTGSSLIKGSSALFGIKTKLQFGKLTATALVSQQNSTTQTVNTSGGAQTTEFYLTADKYDQNRNFFLGHFFRDNYDKWCSNLPLVSSGVTISRIEVWVTNKKGNYSESRNIMAFMDLGETSDHIMNPQWHALEGKGPQPYNSINTLYDYVNADSAVRYISQATSALAGKDMAGGRDYVKLESARLLSSSEYTLNTSLGYIMLNTALASDEALAVAYEYTYGGQTYQVGEFSADITQSAKSLYVKMLKSSTTSPSYPVWDLAMKNVYSLGAYNVQKSNFKLNIKYLSDTTGTELLYMPVGNINGTVLLQVMNLDRLDANNETNPDGKYDYIDGYTVNSTKGRVIFPVVEPFGDHLRSKLGLSDAQADVYVYDELYDTTLTVAQKYTDKNKFVLTGEYQASSGSVIQLNAMNVARGSVVVTAGGVTLTENSDYTVDYTMGTVTIINQSIIDAGTSISVSLENQSTYSTQRKTLLGLDLQYAFNKDLNLGATIMHYGEKALTEKVSFGSELTKNTIWGVNVSYNKSFMWLTNLLNKIPTVNATAPSTVSFTGEFAQLIPHNAATGTNSGSSYLDDFESTQSGIDLRSPYSWFLASTPADLNQFPEAERSNDTDYGKNRALLAWYYIDRLFTQRNSSYCPGYIKNDLDQLSNPYVREVSYTEVFPGRELNYGESSTIQTLNLSFYPNERGPYNVDATNVDSEGNLLNPEKRWGGIMRKIDNTNFEQSNVEYIQFWLLDPFLDDQNPNYDGGYLYINLGDVSEDVLKDGRKSYENGLPTDANYVTTDTTVWGRVSNQTSLTYAFDNTTGSRILQDVGLDGLSTTDEKTFSTYANFLEELRSRISSDAYQSMLDDPFSPFNDPAGDDYHFYRGNDFDDRKLSILERYKHYNGTEGNSLSTSDASDALYQSARSVPDVEDINQDNTLDENENFFQYRIAIHPDSMLVGSNYITDYRVANITTRNGNMQTATWYQFTVPINEYQKKVGSIEDFTSIRFMRMYMTGFKQTTHLRFATLELVRGEWRDYDYNLDYATSDIKANGSISINTVNIEENASREPVNYVLPPGVTRIIDSGQSQVTQLNEQSMQLTIKDLLSGEAAGVYRNMGIDLRKYKRLQMFLHGEALVDNTTNLQDGDFSVFIRLGSDAKKNYYEYEIPLSLTAPSSNYSTNSSADRLDVWPESNMFDIDLDVLTAAKKNRNADKAAGVSGVGYAIRYAYDDDEHTNNKVYVMGNPSLSKVKVMVIGIRNKAATTKSGVIWVDELRVTDFDNEGGWAAKANMTLTMSDIATLNVGYHKETSGFGSVDQSLSSRRMSDYDQFNIAVQGDAGRLLPEAVKLKAPVYYSYSNEKVTPKYNPLDEDVKLKDALDACATQEQKDSIMDYSLTRTVVKSFSISGLKFDIHSKNPMPWDPGNFTFSYSFNKKHYTDPENVYENTNDYRFAMQYSWTPYVKPFKPFARFINEKKKALKFLREWEFRWLPANIAFNSNISRYYYEQQTRNETDVTIDIPVSVSKNFLWDRQFSITWNFTKSLSASFNSNTTAHILEPVGQVNKRLFPDEYRDWKDSVWQSIKDLGTPWAYNQTFTASYKAPFSSIPILSWISATGSYNSIYKWDRGTVVNEVSSGNTIANQSSINVDTRLNFEQFYNKIPYLSDVNKRFSSSGSGNSRDKAKNKKNSKQKAKKFEKTITLSADSATVLKHNMNTKKVRVQTETTDGTPFKVNYKVKDANTIIIQPIAAAKTKHSVNQKKDNKKDKKKEKKKRDRKRGREPDEENPEGAPAPDGDGGDGGEGAPEDAPEVAEAPGSTMDIKFTINEIPASEHNGVWSEIAAYTTRALMSVRNASVRWKRTQSISIPQFIPNIGDIFGQNPHYDVMAPGLDFAFGFVGESYLDKALERGWLMCDETQTSPALFAKTDEFNVEVQLEPIRGLKVTLTGNRTDNRTNQIQFQYSNPYTIYTGSYTKTHVALATALRGMNGDNNYASAAFDRFMENIPIVAQRLQDQYVGATYPTSGFFNGTAFAGNPYSEANGVINTSSSDVLIPAFLAAYSGKSASKVTLSPFPGLKEILPNWRITYDGLIKIGNLKKIFKSFSLTHAYQCTYSVGSYTSYTDWVSIGHNLGFTQDALTGSPIPSSPYNISSVSITEKFAPLIGVAATLNNGMTFNAEYRDARTLTLNASAGQIVEAYSKAFSLTAGYKIANFNTVLKIKKKQKNVNNDLTLNLNVQMSNNIALIRTIDTATAQATSGTRSWSFNFTANYVLSKRLTMGLYFDHQINTPLISSSAYPTTNTSYGLSINLSLAK